MTIASIKITSSPVYALNSLCERNRIPYLHIQQTGMGRHGTDKNYVDTRLTHCKLAIVESLETLETYFQSMLEQKVHWAILVRGSELEASEHSLPYCMEAYLSWVVDLLNDLGTVSKYPVKKLQTNKNNSYLSQVLTDLYRIKPKEERPFDTVFAYLAGKRKFPKNLPPYLVKSLKEAEPIRTAVLDCEQNYDIVNVRAVAKRHKMDVFDINYTLARNGLLPGKE